MEGGSRDELVAQFERAFEEHGRSVLAYALRRCDEPADAEDAVAETFIVVWRRRAEIPAGEEVRPWLYGVCRRVLANQRRGEARRWRLLDRLTRHEPTTQTVKSETGDPPGPAIEALGHLRADDQELLRLVAWEDLRHAEIATVLGITANAVGIRLHRARARFGIEFQLVLQEHALKGLDSSRTSAPVKGTMTGDHVRERPR